MIPDVYKGKPLYASDIKDLCAEVKSNRITTVVGGRFQRGIHGTTIIIPDTNTTTQETAPATVEEFPFRLFAGESSVYINTNSFLFRDASGDTVTITNLNTFYCDPTVGQQIVLDVSIDTFGLPDSAELKCGTWQSVWPTYSNPVVRNSTTKIQTKLIVPIGECSSIDDPRFGFQWGESVKVIQMTNTDLCCFLTQIRGLAAIVAMPWYRKNQVA